MVSVTLFALAINDVADDLPSNVNNALFFDDFTMWTTSSSSAAAERQLQIGWESSNG